jgi:hypothetical protein
MTEWACTSNAQDPTYVVTCDWQSRVHGAAAIQVRLTAAEIQTEQFQHVENENNPEELTRGVGRILEYACQLRDTFRPPSFQLLDGVLQTKDLCLQSIHLGRRSTLSILPFGDDITDGGNVGLKRDVVAREQTG